MRNSGSQRGIVSLVLVVFLLIVAAGGAGLYYYLQNSSTRLPEVINKIPVLKNRQLTLNLESPSDGTLAVNNRILVKGTTSPNTTVVFYNDIDQSSVESDANGRFEGNLALAEGINSLVVTAFAENGEEKSVTVEIVNDPQSTNI